jgi:hypothetical protein
MRRGVGFAVVALWVVGWSGAAFGQERMIVIEDSEWVVDLEKPSAYFMLQPSSLSYEEEESEESFLDELYTTVEEAPF